MHSAFPYCGNISFYPDLERDYSLQQLGMAPAKIGGIIGGSNFIWAESIGWVNLRTAHADVRIGSNILAGWVWFENCGWVCLGDGHPLDGRSYSNRGSRDWGVNNDGRGNLSGYAWSEVTGWINFQTDHARVCMDKAGRFCGYAWGENVGWMQFGLGGRVSYLAKADPGPWREMGDESRSRLAGGPDDSKMSSGSVTVAGLKNKNERYNTDAWTVCSRRLGRDDTFACIRHYDTPVHIIGLATSAPIRAPPVIV
ncbi:MAG: hypothetical protein NTZ78_07010 [Candidatus Aureabacteria bacterium]|nr:hypothetical protein [Candidatus Auribacterota bacterium]